MGANTIYLIVSHCKEHDRTSCVVAETAADFIDEANASQAPICQLIFRGKQIRLGSSPEPEQGGYVKHCPGRKEPSKR